MPRICDCIIVGAGASGLLAACLAEEAGLAYILIEKKEEPGKKLLLTGGGRSNFGHVFEPSMEEIAAHYYGKAAARFLCPALRALDGEALRALLRPWGLESSRDAEGRLYPQSGKARDLRDCLWGRLETERVLLGHEVLDLDYGEAAAGGALRVYVSASGESQGRWLAAKTLLLAGGGTHFRMTGSDGSLLALLERRGLAVTPTRPALAALGGGENPFATLSGLSLEEAELRILPGRSEAPQQRRELRLRGPLLFTHRGISGPLGLDASRYYPWEQISLNFCLLETHEMEALLLEQIKKSPLALVLPELQKRLPKALARLILAELLAAEDKAEQPERAPCRFQDLGKRGLRRLAQLLTAHGLAELRPLEATAMLTRGGLVLGDWQAKSMEHKRIPGLYAAGELLDIDGRTGGYNLQAAFATAQLAMRSIVQRLQGT